MFKSSFPTRHTQCIKDLNCFETFRNCCFFCTFWLFRNYYSGDAHHVNYGKHSSTHHFRHGAPSVYKIYSVFKLFEFAVCFSNFDFFEITTRVMFKSSFPTRHTQCIKDLNCFETFRNCCFFCTFWLFRNYYSGDAHHVNYVKHSLHRHFRHCAHSVYRIYSVLKLFEIALCSAQLTFSKLLLRWCSSC